MSEQAQAKLSAALVAASAEMPAVAFDSKNPFLGNQFASLGAVIAAARPILAKHGLAIMQFACSNSSGQIGVRTRLIHSSGEWLEESIYLDVSEEKGKSRAQVAGSIITYLRRYAQSALLNLYADEDTDGNAPGANPTHPERTPSPPHRTPTKAATAAPGATGAAKGSAAPNPEKCKARFLEKIEEKKWVFFAWLYAVRQGWIMDTERLEDGSPSKFPATADSYAKVEEAIKALMAEAVAKGGPAQAEQEAYDAAYLEVDPDDCKREGTEHEPWMDVVLPFGKEKGKKLGELPRNYLFGMAKNYEPKPYKGKISDKDTQLRKALDEALSWMDEHKEPRNAPQVYHAPTDDNVPF